MRQSATTSSTLLHEGALLNLSAGFDRLQVQASPRQSPEKAHHAGPVWAPAALSQAEQPSNAPHELAYVRWQDTGHQTAACTAVRLFCGHLFHANLCPSSGCGLTIFIACAGPILPAEQLPAPTLRWSPPTQASGLSRQAVQGRAVSCASSGA